MNRRAAFAISESGGRERIADHFGRCTKFTVCELDDRDDVVATETYFNPLAGQKSGAGQIPGYVNQFNISAIVSCGMGEKVVAKFFQFGIDVIIAPGLLFEEALARFRHGGAGGFELIIGDHNNGHIHTKE